MKKSVLNLVFAVAVVTSAFGQNGSVEIPYTSGAIVIDASDNDEGWAGSTAVNIELLLTDATMPDSDDLSGTAKLAWNDNGYFVYVKVTDDVINTLEDGVDAYLRDNVEFFTYFGADGAWDEGGPDETHFLPQHSQVRLQLNEAMETAISGNQNGTWAAPVMGDDEGTITAMVKQTNDGYDVEVFFPWAIFDMEQEVATGMTFGFDIQLADADEGDRDAQLFLNNATGADMGWSSSKHFGTATLKEETVSISGNQFFDKTLVYPTVVNDNFNVSNGVTQLAIYNSLGQQIEIISNAQSVVNVSGLNSGVYFVKVKTEFGHSTVKIIKK